jgi:hypothetical protein
MTTGIEGGFAIRVAISKNDRLSRNGNQRLAASHGIREILALLVKGFAACAIRAVRQDS